MVNEQLLEYSYSLFDLRLYKRLYMPFIMDRRFLYKNVYQFSGIRELVLSYNSNNLPVESHESIIGNFFFLRFLSNKAPYFLPKKSSYSLYQKRTYNYICVVRFSGEEALVFFSHYIAYASNRVSFTDFGLYKHLITNKGVTFFLKNYPQFRIVNTHPVFLDWKSTLDINVKWARSCDYTELADILFLLKSRSWCLNVLLRK